MQYCIHINLIFLSFKVYYVVSNLKYIMRAGGGAKWVKEKSFHFWILEPLMDEI